jgi:anti-anti-sigma factor
MNMAEQEVKDNQGDVVLADERTEVTGVVNKEHNLYEISLGGEVNIYSARKLKQVLIELVDKGQDMKVSLSGVSELDTSGFQLLLSWKKTAAAEGRKLQFHSHSSVVLDYLDLYGAVGLLGDKVVLNKQSKEDYTFSYGLKKQSLV